jgi:hypothetical protein
VVRLGKLNETVAYRVIRNANKMQKAFEFEYIQNITLHLDEKYKLSNNGYDLDSAVEDLCKSEIGKVLPRPLVILTDDAMGENEYENEPDYFFFMSRLDNFDKGITIITTQPRVYLKDSRSYEDFLLLMFATYLLAEFADLEFHDDTQGCLLDYCDELTDLEKAFQTGKLCLNCEQELQKAIQLNRVSIEQVAAAKRLMNIACGKKTCFVAMQFDPMFDSIYQTIKDTLTPLGWTISRSDQVAFPRLIPARIYLEILTADLVIAEITGNNPNVFFEVGMVNVIGNDLLLLSQEDKIPFDSKDYHTILYKGNNIDLLSERLKIHCV